MEEIYAYRLPGRRLAIWAAGALVVLLLTLAATYPAPWFIWAIWLPAGGAILYLLVRNPASGVRLMRDRLILSAWQKPREVLLSDIEKIVFVTWSDSTDMVVHLTTGHEIRVFHGDIPPRDPFIDGLSRVGVVVEER